MHKAIFVKSIWDSDTAESSKALALFQREEALPFAPVPGVEMSWRGMSQAVVAVRWEVETNCFICTMKSEYPHSIDLDDYDFEWLVQSAINNGWLLVAKNQL